MRKILFTILLTFIVSMSFAQGTWRQHRQFKMPQIDMSQYVLVDSLPLERITIFSPYDYEGDEVISLGSGQYLIEMPYYDKMIIKTNKDRTKAIVLYNSYCFGRHKEFNIKETDKRIILWYEDEDVYCGYQYDKRYKVCKYFENWWDEIDKRKNR